MLPHHPRWVNRFYAYLFGYFWLPCPICCDNYGGHESNHDHPIRGTGGVYRVVCWRSSCKAMADRITKVNGPRYQKMVVSFSNSLSVTPDSDSVTLRAGGAIGSHQHYNDRGHVLFCPNEDDCPVIDPVLRLAETPTFHMRYGFGSAIDC